MKHLSTLLLTLGLGATCAVGQNVTVVMKDGTSHKFNADYLSEIKFLDAGQETPSVEFKGIEIYSDYPGNFTVSLTDEAGTTECVVDIYCPEDAKWLLPGNYPFDYSTDEFTFDGDPEYSYLTVDGETKAYIGGNVDIAVEGNVYEFTLDLQLEDSSSFRGHYKGEIPFGSQCYAAELSQSSYNENPQLPGTFYVKFNDTDWKYDIAMIFNAATDATTLPAGTYTLSEVVAPGTISTQSYLDRYYPYNSYRLAAGSQVTVECTDGIYDIVMNLLLDDGHTAQMTYHGEITGTPTFEVPEPEMVELTTIDVDVYSDGNVTLYFTDESGDIELDTDLYGAETDVWLKAGTYNYGTEGEYRLDPYYSGLKRGDGEELAILDGNVVVANDGDNYEINVDLAISDGTRFKGRYAGPVPGYSQHLQDTMVLASYNENEQEPGTFYVKFNDAAWRYDMALIMHADASAKTLPAGEYILGEGTAVGTLSTDSYVDMYYPTCSLKLEEGSKVTVTEEDGVYGVTMEFNLSDGRTASLTYNGEISGTPTFIDNSIPMDIYEVDVYSNGNVTLTLQKDELQFLVLDLYGSENAVCLEPGTYVLDAEEGFYIDNWYSGYAVYANVGDEEPAESYQFNSCTVEVTENEGIYTIDAQLVLDNGTPLHVKFEGKLPKYSTLLEGTVNKAEYNDAQPREAGNIYVRFEDSIDWVYTLGIDFFCNPEATELEAGTYTYGGQGTEPGTFGFNSYCDVYEGSSVTNRMTEGSTIQVEKAENVYTITMDLKFESGRAAVVTYNGEITGAPLFK